MATEPSELPRWADDGAAGIVEPSEGKKDLGFSPGERPPAQYLDWLFNRIYLWLWWLAKGPWEHHIHAFSAVYDGTDWSRNTAGYIVNSTSTQNVYFSIPLRNGDRITSIVVNRRGTGTADFVYTLFEMDGAGGQATVDNDTSDTAVAATWGSKTLAFTATSADDLQTHFLQIAVNGNGSRIESIIVTVERA